MQTMLVGELAQYYSCFSLVKCKECTLRYSANSSNILVRIVCILICKAYPYLGIVFEDSAIPILFFN